MRNGLIRLLEGDANLKVDIVSIPTGEGEPSEQL